VENIYALFEDREFLRSIYSFSYARTNNTHDADDLSSEIVLQALKSAKRNSDIQNPYAFVWSIAKRTYADFCENRSKYRNRVVCNEYSDSVINIAFCQTDDLIENDDSEWIKQILREIAFLSKIYREVCIMYYLEGKTVAEIAKALGIKETTVKQRLFYARDTIKKGVETMENKYPTLNPISICFVGTGNPAHDPSMFCHRKFSQNLVYLCKDTPKSAKELSEILNVPMLFIEEEIEIQVKGANGYNGLLRETDKGKYISIFIFLDCDDYTSVNNVFKRNTDIIAERLDKYLKDNEEKLLQLPFLNKSVTLQLIAWGMINQVTWWFENEVTKKIEQKYLSNVERTKRDYYTFGIATKPGEEINVGFYGCDGIYGRDIAGYKEVHAWNMYGNRIEMHFPWSHNISTDETLLFMLKSIKGVSVSSLSKKEKETASRAIEVGYCYKDGDMIYAKPLVMENNEEILHNVVSDFVSQIKDLVDRCVEELYQCIRKYLPAHLMGEYHIFTQASAAGLLDGLIEKCIEIGTLNVPNKLCAEGMRVVVAE